MYGFEDYFEYAMDITDEQRAAMLADLQRTDPDMARRLRDALANQVKNPDFLCQTVRPAADANAPDRVRHLTMRVAELDPAVQWYTRTFRCGLLLQEGNRAVLAFDGGFEVHLVAGEDADAPRMTVMRADVAAMGASRRRANGVRGLHIVDPWGNSIEVVDGPAIETATEGQPS